MSQEALERFGAYQKGRQLFDLVVAEMAVLRKDPCCYRLVAQQMGSADSICANIEEGFGRLSRAEYVRFLDFARGSARETRGRYQRLEYWLGAEVVRQRLDLLDQIIGILTATIERLRHDLSAGPRGASGVREDLAEYSAGDALSPDTHPPLDTRPATRKSRAATSKPRRTP